MSRNCAYLWPSVAVPPCSYEQATTNFDLKQHYFTTQIVSMFIEASQYGNRGQLTPTVGLPTFDPES